MCDYPFFIPQVVLFANSSLFWFKVTNEHREFRNYLKETIQCIRLMTFDMVQRHVTVLIIQNIITSGLKLSEQFIDT